MTPLFKIHSVKNKHYVMYGEMKTYPFGFTRIKWKPFISYAGLPNCAYPFTSKERAIKNAVETFQKYLTEQPVWQH
jgi:hypothetical protein